MALAAAGAVGGHAVSNGVPYRILGKTGEKVYELTNRRNG
jgi:hypothetical protein